MNPVSLPRYECPYRQFKTQHDGVERANGDPLRVRMPKEDWGDGRANGDPLRVRMPKADWGDGCANGDPLRNAMPQADWSGVPSVRLRDTVTGGTVREMTSVQACWNEQGLLVRFACEDSYILSDFTRRDEPLYEQDVVELFIDEEGDGRQYMELEVSPRGIVFDARISNDGSGKPQGIQADTGWDADGLAVKVETPAAGSRAYELFLPAAEFRSPLRKGLKWRVNAYRIDHAPGRDPELQAWSPTGKPWFHVPERFGQFVLGE